MSKLFSVYGRGQAEFQVLPPPQAFANAPTSHDTKWSVGQIGYTPGPNASDFYIYAGAGSWLHFANSSGNILAVNGTANQITASTASGIATLSLPSAITAPGSLTTTTSLASTTTITAGTGLTITSGNATFSASGAGIVYNPVVVTAAASPQTANGRVFSVTFSGVSIAAGATQTFVINNTSVNTLAQITKIGATSGSALSIQSITYSAGVSITIVVTNGTGATTSTANITFTGVCLN